MTLFPYQIEGANYLAAKDQALLADEMGLGKSCQAITAADIANLHKIVVVCTAAGRINWQREFAMWSIFDRPVCALFTAKDLGSSSLEGIVIVSYDLLTNPKVLAHLKKTKWDLLILDEAHYLKERTAKRTKAIYKQLAPQASRVWRLTGTPAPNNASELWTHLHSSGIYQRGFHDFVDRYCTGFDSGFGLKITGSKNLPELKGLLKQIMLRRKKEDVMKQLPPISYHNMVVEPSPVDEDLFFADKFIGSSREAFHAELKQKNDALKALWAQSQGSRGQTDSRISVLEGLSTPMSTLRRYIGLSKVPEVAKILAEELESGALDKVVIFAVHRDVIVSLRDALKKYGVEVYFGGMTPEKKQRAIDRFQNQDKYRVFIGHIVAAGSTITLTRAHEVVLIEPSWVPAENAQAVMRCHRIGQEKPVRVRIYSVAGSTDEDINAALRRKIADLTKIFD
ncbi:HepA Superfamily II DNA/RNA helicases, SNF2 family [uncultured Caudovirales phage]|uniref:HepA Superfamily II DNA/RNA helicases, SNF2 family n=1 Tax=uncultured Caudovirales phage TaxID=2100421 RepID=A0A6J5KI20_9CAUD|nr:HepA Superfamily II DNA/RNA helicases, SNF2 family [uncultured Caudovirales phage]